MIPGLWIGILIYLYGVDVPYQDQFDAVCSLFQKMEAGTLHLSDFFALHSEHRLFFPRLISYGLAILTSWNVRAELFLIWLLAWLCSFNFWQLGRATGWGTSTSFGWLFIGLNILLFTPSQSETWLMGLQTVFLLPLVCLSGSLWIALEARPAIRFLGTLALATVSTFCMASGMLCWSLTFPLLFFRDGQTTWRADRRWWALWLAAFLANVFLYFNGYQKPTYHPSTTEFSLRPLDALHFIMIYLGGDFGLGTAFPPSTLAAIAGAILVLLLAGCIIYLWRYRRDRALLAQALPWLMPAGFALANAALAMVGRLGFGVNWALMSRYITFSIMLPIALLFLVSLVFIHWAKNSDQREHVTYLRTALTSLATIFATLHFLGAFSSLRAWSETKRQRLVSKALILLIDVADEPELWARYVHDNVAPLKARVNLLDHLGYLRPGLVHSRFIRDISDPASAGAERFGALQQVGKTESQQMAAVGWAALPEAHRSADAVLLTYDDAGGQPVIFEVAPVGTPRADVAAASEEPAYLWSGWMKILDPQRIPKDAKVLKAWAFDAEHGRAYRIDGQVSIKQ